MKIITWNVNGIRSCDKKNFREYFAHEQADVFCIQETRALKQQVDQWLVSPPGYTSHWSMATRKGYSGTTTYVRTPARLKAYECTEVQHGIGIPEFDGEGRFVITSHKNIDIYNIYFPNGASSLERHNFKQNFLTNLQKHVLKELKRGRHIIVVGDYNVAYQEADVHDPVRLSQVSGFLPEERQWFEGFLKCGFVDAFRHFHPNERDRYSWWSYREQARPRNLGWRIDHICVSQALVPRLVRADILDHIMGSDHCPLVELKGT